MPPSPLLTLTAALLGFAGATWIFAPQLLAGHAALGAQLYGAALLGIAVANWVARRAPVGGIYGRALVSGNLAHAVAGTLTLVGAARHRPDAPALWAAAALYGALAAGFWWLLRGGRRARAADGDRTT